MNPPNKKILKKKKKERKKKREKNHLRVIARITICSYNEEYNELIVELKSSFN